MSGRLAERLAAAKGTPIDFDGRLVYMMFELPPISGPAKLLITIDASTERPQAVRLKARGGEIVINGQLDEDVVLWSDTAPQVVLVSLRPQSSRTPMTLRVWNAWRDTSGVMQAWIGDAGMLVEEPAPGEIVLRCSDGYDTPNFDDLLVRLTLSSDE